eukprot:6203426-Pleurochrysis_carterae.AAC.3
MGKRWGRDGEWGWIVEWMDQGRQGEKEGERERENHAAAREPRSSERTTQERENHAAREPRARESARARESTGGLVEPG